MSTLRIRLQVWLFALVLLFPLKALASDYRDSSDTFYRLEPDLRAIVQYGLIWTGDYNGLVDGQFGPGTYEAIKSFRRKEGWADVGRLDDQVIGLLIERAKEQLERVGFEILTDPSTQIEIGLPTRLLGPTQPTSTGVRYETPDSSFVVDLLVLPASEGSFWDLYERLGREDRNRKVSYSTFKGEHFIVTGTEREKRFYIRVYKRPQDYRGFAAAWNERVYGEIDPVIIAMSNTLGGSSGGDQVASSDPEGSEPGSGGSGFFLNDDMIITNRHVVEGCGTLTAAGFGRAVLLDFSDLQDIAVLRLSSPSQRPPAQACLRDSDGRLGEAVVVTGYPLGPILNNALTVTTGNVSSLTGLGGDDATFAFSAPIQPGNSGGPVLDGEGRVIGITMAKLDDRKTLEHGGFVAQNVNFAIKASKVRDFLNSSYRPTGPSCSTEPTSREGAIELASRFTVQILCSASKGQ